MTRSPLTTALAALSLTLAAAPALAGDAAAGEKVFAKCKACHSIIAPDGTEVVKAGKVGPNLYGVIGAVAGVQADFADKFGDGLKAAGAAGLVWTEELLVAYLADTNAFVAEKAGDAAAKSKMTFKLADATAAADVAAYLASVAPAAP